MRKYGKKYLAVLLIVSMMLLMLPQWKNNEDGRVQAATVMEIADSTNLQEIITECNSTGEAVTVKLTDNITGIISELQLTAGELTIDLNGYQISANTQSRSAVFASSGKSILNLKDTSQGQTGGILNTNSLGGVINKTGGTLNISGGTYTGSAYCIRMADSEINLTGGDFIASHATDGITLHIFQNSTLNISGTPTFTSNYGTVFVPSDSSGSEIRIEGGTFTVNENGSFGFTCYIDGQCNLNITGGTFILNAQYGKSLFIGTNVSDEDVSIAGGTYQGRIARATADASGLNETAFYGDEKENDGIIAEGFVLTNNTFSTEPVNILYTEANVSVVEGSLIKFDTLRYVLEKEQIIEEEALLSVLEEYQDTVEETEDTADQYAVDPVSVGKDGLIYTNTNSNTTPGLDEEKITDGNQYGFLGWYDETGAAYASIEEYVAKQGEKLADTTLYAGWNAKTGTLDGLESAITKTAAVRKIEVTEDISLTASVAAYPAEPVGERILDLGTHRILADFSALDAGEAALVCSGNWRIQNGTIEAIQQACLLLDGTAVLEDINCKSENFDYAVGFRNQTEASMSRILSGTFETTMAGGHALYLFGGNDAATAEQLTNLLKDSYVSSTATAAEGMHICLDAAKLLAAKTPITYLESGADVNLGTYARGDALPFVSMTVSNQEYVGDIVINCISVDNPAFLVTGEETARTLIGGSGDTYSYKVAAAADNQPGTYQGTVSIHYTKMDGTAGTYQQKVIMTVAAKQLAISEPLLGREKTYDGTATVTVSAGTLSGVIAQDEVSIVAEAKYDNAEPGTGKTITVTYTLTGADSGYYAAPANMVYTDGKINKASGVGTVSIADYHVGETAAKPTVASNTNGITSVTYYYKKKDAADTTYSTKAPAEEGTYILKAVFAETNHYQAATATTDFKISYIATPKSPYTLSGTKGSNGWYKSKVVIKPAKGYKIAAKQTGTYGSTYTVSSSAKPVVYLKNTNGAVTKAIQVEALKIDSSAPKITGISNGAMYYSDGLKAVVSDANLKSVTVNGGKVSVKGKSVTLSLSPTGEQTVIEARDQAGNVRKYTLVIEEAWVKEGIVSDGVKKLVSKKSYKLGSGNWKVNGDATVYRGGKNVYVSNNGDYDFKKQ